MYKNSNIAPSFLPIVQVEFDVLMVVVMKSFVFRDVMLYSLLIVGHYSRKRLYLCLQDQIMFPAWLILQPRR
jgi:hypothetical protein